MNTTDVMSALPNVLAEDEYMNALAQSVADKLVGYYDETDLARIYEKIDTLPEALCDILAYDYKCDWWDYSFTLAEKRKTLKSLWYVHKHKGTPAAVARALSSIYAATTVTEWFDTTDMLPYHFNLEMSISTEQIDDDPTDPDNPVAVKHSKVVRLLSFYKNLRSKLDTILYSVTTIFDEGIYIGSHVGGSLMITEALEDGSFVPKQEFTLTTFGIFGSWMVTELVEASIAEDYGAYTDENNDVLTDENGDILIMEE